MALFKQFQYLFLPILSIQDRLFLLSTCKSLHVMIDETFWQTQCHLDFKQTKESTLSWRDQYICLHRYVDIPFFDAGHVDRMIHSRLGYLRNTYLELCRDYPFDHVVLVDDGFRPLSVDSLPTDQGDLLKIVAIPNNVPITRFTLFDYITNSTQLHGLILADGSFCDASDLIPFEGRPTGWLVDFLCILDLPCPSSGPPRSEQEMVEYIQEKSGYYYLGNEDITTIKLYYDWFSCDPQRHTAIQLIRDKLKLEHRLHTITCSVEDLFND